MKAKNINPLELYLDKLVLLVCLAGLGYSIWAYTVAQTFTIDVNNQPVEVGQVDTLVLEQARTLKAEINKPAHSELTRLRPPDYPQQFNQQFTASLTPGGRKPLTRIAALENPNILGTATVIATEKAPKYNVPVVPAPTQLLAASAMGTVNPQVLNPQSSPQLLARLGKPPYDLQWVSVSCLFNAQALRDSLVKTPEDGDVRPIPPEWWTSSLALVDVELQREEKLPDGSWGNRVTVPAMPDSIKSQFRRYTEKVDLSYAKQMISSLLQYQPQIMQPPFPALIEQQWLPPAQQLALAESTQAQQPEDRFAKDSRVQTLTKQIETLTKQLEQIQANILRMENLNRPVPPNLTQRAQQLQTRLQDLQRQLQERIDQLQQAAPPATTPTPTPGTGGLGEVFPGGEMAPPPMPGTGPIPGQTFVPSSGGGLLNAQALELYAHDLSVEPGKTYRYRARVFIVNPLYGQKLDKEQAEKYARLFKLPSDWSEWTEPVETLRMQYHFLLSGAQATQSAAVEVWQFTSARWYKAKFNVSPGDVIGGPTSSIEPLFNTGQPLTVVGPLDMNTGHVVVDIDFEYPIQVGNITRNTVRLLYVGSDQDIRFLYQAQDAKRLEETRQLIKKRFAIEEVPQEPELRQPYIPQPPGPRQPYPPRTPYDRRYGPYGPMDEEYVPPPPPPSRRR